ncbi:unnamed protein product, partial [Tenebrio molitor]
MTVEIIGESAPASNLGTIVLSTAENFATGNVSNERVTPEEILQGNRIVDVVYLFEQLKKICA